MISSLLPLLTLLAVGDAEASSWARDFAEEVVEKVLEEEVRPRWVASSFLVSDPDVSGEARAAASAASIHEELSWGGPLFEAISATTGVVGEVVGPDYVRVIFGGEQLFFMNVMGHEGRVVVGDMGVTSCLNCSESERFVSDLIANVTSRGAGAWGLVPGIDLQRSERSRRAGGYSDWVRAWLSRNITSGYLYNVLSQSRVTGGSGDGVYVEVAGAQERWEVEYRDGRWALLYDELPEESALRMSREQLRRFGRRTRLSQARAEWGRPLFTNLEEGETLIEGDLLHAELRPIQGDLLLYGHDVGRRWAHLAVVDPQSGEVIRSHAVPTLSTLLKIRVEEWRERFSFDLSSDGQRLLVGAFDKAWLLEVESGEVLWRGEGFGEISAVALASDDSGLAVADLRGVTRYTAGEGRGFESRGRVRLEAGSVALLEFEGAGLHYVTHGGEMGRLSMVEARGGPREVSQLGCEPLRGGSYLPERRALQFGCVGRDGEGARRLSVVEWDLANGEIAEEPLEWPLSQELEGRGGVFSLFPSADGRPVTTVELGGEEVVADDGVLLLERPLLELRFDSADKGLWSLDRDGRLWRWSDEVVAEESSRPAP